VGFHEDMSYTRVSSIGPGATYGNVADLGHTIWWSYVVPTVGWQGTFNIRQFGNGLVGSFTLYHPGWGAVLGAGVGFAYVHRHRVLAWGVAVAAMLVTYSEHMANNWEIGYPNVPVPIVGDLFTAGDQITGATELAVYLLLGAIAASIVTDLSILRRGSARVERHFPPPLEIGRNVGGSAGTPWRLVRSLSALATYARLRRSMIVAVWGSERSIGNPDRLDESLDELAAIRSRIVRGEPVIR
jgi:hypothetical protein